MPCCMSSRRPWPPHRLSCCRTAAAAAGWTRRERRHPGRVRSFPAPGLCRASRPKAGSGRARRASDRPSEPQNPHPARRSPPAHAPARPHRRGAPGPPRPVSRFRQGWSDPPRRAGLPPGRRHHCARRSATWAPPATNLWTVARPAPLVPPVTTTRRPWNSAGSIRAGITRSPER